MLVQKVHYAYQSILWIYAWAEQEAASVLKIKSEFT